MKIYANNRQKDINSVLKGLAGKDLWIRVTLDGEIPCWIKVRRYTAMHIKTYYNCYVCYDRYLSAYKTNKSMAKFLSNSETLVDDEIEFPKSPDIVTDAELFENGVNL